MERVFVESSERIGLSVLTREDIPVVWKTMMDPEVNRYLNARWGLYYLENEYEWYESLSKNSDNQRVFGIVLKGGEEIAGIISLNEINFKNRNVHIGYFLQKKYWKRGIITEALQLLKKYCFGELNLRKMYTSVFQPNEASIRVLEKTGFECVGKYRSHVYIPEFGYVDELHYEIFNEALDGEEKVR